ncbi:hypothetical protein ACNOYE_16935 [Nannocystaceae bacterium ST9]
MADWIAADGARSAVIGAVALAIHGHVRATRDLDLATEIDPAMQLRALSAKARAQGWTVDLQMPDQDDPLGGVLTVTGDDFDPVQVVNFHNPFRTSPNPAREALIGAVDMHAVPGLKVVRVEELVLLKLYAGGIKGLVDVHELLEAHPEVDRAALRGRAARFGLEREFDRALDES